MSSGNVKGRLAALNPTLSYQDTKSTKHTPVRLGAAG